MPGYMSKNAFERKMRQERQKEDFQKALQTSIREAVIFKTASESDAKVERARQRKVALEKAEEQRKMEIQKLKDAEDFKRRAVKNQEAALLKELRRRDSELNRNKARHRQIVAQSEELKDLELKLRSTLLNKERQIQLVEMAKQKEELAQKEKEMEIAECKHMPWGSDDVEAEKRRKALAEQKVILEQQLIEKELRKNEEYERHLQEKAAVDLVVRKIEEEERAKMEKVAAKRAETKAYVENYLVERAKWLKQQELEQKAEIEGMMEHQRKMDERKQRAEEEKARQAAEEAAKYKAVVQDIQSKNNDAEEMERALMDLAMEEAQLKIVEAERERIRKREELRKEMIQENLNQQRLKAERVAQEKEEEDRIRAQLLAKFAEDDRLEQFARQKARLKVIEHRKSVEAILVERRKIKAQEEVENAKLAEFEMRDLAERKAIVDAERERLLKNFEKKLKDIEERKKRQEAGFAAT